MVGEVALEVVAHGPLLQNSSKNPYTHTVGNDGGGERNQGCHKRSEQKPKPSEGKVHKTFPIISVMASIQDLLVDVNFREYAALYKRGQKEQQSGNLPFALLA